jgi:hypothetical protein
MIAITRDPQDMEYWQVFEDHYTYTSQNGFQLVLDELGRPIFADELGEFIAKVTEASHNRRLKLEIDKALTQQDPLDYLKKLQNRLATQPLDLL